MDYFLPIIASPFFWLDQPQLANAKLKLEDATRNKTNKNSTKKFNLEENSKYQDHSTAWSMIFDTISGFTSAFILTIIYYFLNFKI